MNPRRTFDLALLIAATALTRFAFRSHLLYDIDSVNFALALRRFDPGAYQPHPPGYFLYVCLGRLANMLFHDANSALVAISIVFSCAAVAMVYVLTNAWFDRSAARFAGLVFLCSPLAWFHGTVALTYIVEAFFSAMVGYLCWQVYGGNGRFVLWSAVAAGIAAGFRPSSFLFLGPLFLFSLGSVSRRRAIGGIGAVIATILAWFIPMMRITGADTYFSSLLSLWLAVPAKSSVFNSSPVNSLARAVVIAFVYLLCFGCAALLPFRAAPMNRDEDRRKTRFTWVWLTPGLLFFTFVFLRFVNSGYLLILAPPICAWMGLWASQWYAGPGSRKAWRMLTIAGCAAVNAAIFIWAPLYCSYTEVRRFEKELGDIIAALPAIAPSRETMIIGLDSHFLGYRHAGYYLPGYLTLQFPEVQLASGRSVFVMRDQDTGVKRALTTGSIQNFVIFPLSCSDQDNTDFMATVRKRLPSRDLRVISRAGHEFAMGPVEDLHFLFPLVVAGTLPVANNR